MSRICFQVVPPIDQGARSVFLTGNARALGEWSSDAMVPLTWEAPFFTAEIEANEGDCIEFKLTCGNWETEEVDAWGNVPDNHVHDVWSDAHVRVVVADWKDRYVGRLTADRVWSELFAGPRELLVWLPPAYASDSSRRFPVWVLSDGRNAFNPVTSPISGVDLAADEWVRLLSAEGVMPEAIVVAVCHDEGFASANMSHRDADLSLEHGGQAFARFLTTELISYIDAHYRTLASPESRILSGVSLGGLNAVHTAFHCPGIFGKVMAFSASFEDLSQTLPNECEALAALDSMPSLPGGIRLFLDYGMRGLDECYDPYFREVGSILRQKGWQDGREFRILRVAGGTHDELSWRNRLGDGLRFVCGT